MKTLLDTSVLVAAFVGRHPRHTVAMRCYQAALAPKNNLLVAAHSLAELYAVLTRLPSRPRITGGVARSLIRDNVSRPARIVTLSGSDYASAIDRMADKGLTGGAVFDALVAQAAIKADAKRLFTFNRSDFVRVWPEAGERLQVPA